MKKKSRTVPVSCLYDTGASASLIKHRVYKSIIRGTNSQTNAKLTPTNTNLKPVSGISLEHFGTVVLKLNIDNHWFPVRLMVMNDNSCSYNADLFLGTNLNTYIPIRTYFDKELIEVKFEGK